MGPNGELPTVFDPVLDPAAASVFEIDTSTAASLTPGHEQRHTDSKREPVKIATLGRESRAISLQRHSVAHLIWREPQVEPRADSGEEHDRLRLGKILPLIIIHPPSKKEGRSLRANEYMGIHG